MAISTHTGFCVSVGKAIAFIIGVTLAISGSTAIGVILHSYNVKVKINDPDYQARALVQRSAGRYHLPTSALIELLDLSIDQPKHLYSIDVDTASKHLSTLGIFKHIQITKIPPETILVEYELRDPIAYLDDLANTAIDSELVAFPFFPYYTPKKMPKLHLNKGDIKWNTSITDHESADFIRDLLTHIDKYTAQDEKISWIDISSTMQNENPLQEIVLGIDAKTKKWVRVRAENFQDQLNQYLNYHSQIQEWEKTRNSQLTIVDLRFTDTILLSH